MTLHTTKFLLFPLVALGFGSLVGTSCVSVEYGTIAFRCNPRQDDNCPDDYECCSSDPATLTTRSGDQRLFSGTRNSLSEFGMCIRKGDLRGTSFALPESPDGDCPVPCNPQWGDALVEGVCGAGRVCCQTREVEPLDCTGAAPATNAEALACARDSSCTNWAQHPSAQDPNFQRCTELSRDGSGTVIQATFEACAETLSVANQRGFCMAPDPNRRCLNMGTPFYTDACAQGAGGEAGA